MNYIIIEIANTHGGDSEYVHELISTFSEYNLGYGMKFQPLHPDKLATKDFEWHSVYQELFFDSQHWRKILQKAHQTKDIWLDIFDEYGVQILEENFELIYGIKLQVSVLFNLEVRRELSKLDLKGKKLILNVAALEVDEIKYFLDDFEKSLNPEEVLLEVGFQGYPTQLEDSGLSKIKKIKEIFGKRIVFADHVEGSSEYAVWLPSLAVSAGADVIEKHVMLGTRETKYDAYSSITFDFFEKMVEKLDDMSNLLRASFINDREKAYLEKSILKPILKRGFSKGALLNIHRDFEFRRSNQIGLNTRELDKMLSQGYVLSQNKNEGETVHLTDIKQPTIAVIVACRLKSSRLKEKAILPIGDLPSVSYCLRNACKFERVNHVILATSTLDTDAPLANYTFNNRVIFHTGDPEDVIQRYLDICRKLKIDIVIRVTADMPFIDNEICQILLDSHFKTGADYTAAKEAAVGTNLEVINVASLEKIKNYFPSADYSEYMTWYFMNNQEHFNINLVDLPQGLIRDYRLTLDYDEDLQMFNKIHEVLVVENPFYGIRDIFKFLDDNKEVSAINNHITLKYRTDQNLINTLNQKTKIRL